MHSGLRASTWVWLGTAAAVIALGFLGFDRWFYEHVSLVLNTEDRPLDRDFYAVTKPFWETWRWVFGSVVGIVTLGVVATILQPRRWAFYLAGLVSIAGTALLANGLQGAIGRLRPNQAASALAFAPPLSQLVSKERVGFPSGEAATAFALACVAARLWPRGKSCFYAAAAFVAVARLVNGAHYPSDVVAGGVLGVLAGGVFFRWLARVGQKGAPPASTGGDVS